MGFLFGNKNKNNTSKKDKKNNKRKNEEMSDKEKAELELKRQRDRLKKYEITMNKKIDKETEMCKQCLKAGKKDKAKLFLRKKKYQTNLLNKARDQLLNIENLILEVESAQMSQDIFKAMKQGTELLQQINDEMPIDEVEKLMDDTAEAIEYQNEINALLSENLTNIDDDEILQELNQIEQQEADQLNMDLPEPNKSNNVDSNENVDDTTIVEEEPKKVVAQATT
mmetsp:Transcript_107709/g.131428  ORF Transcript_107709/g.131428 Transcript_107709/m.131428 type:complete len:225 (+) Transcript_107709:137-811(+)